MMVLDREDPTPYSGEIPTEKSLKVLLVWAQSQLGFLEPRERQNEAECLLGRVAGMDRFSLYLHADKVLTADQFDQLCSLLEKRKQKMPLAYLLGEAPFWNEVLAVGPGCLIPRPETETLLHAFIRYTSFDLEQSFHVLDLCTGSGALAVAILRQYPKARATASDESQEALAYAVQNLRRYALEHRAEAIQSNLFEAFQGRQWDAVVSNPPYLADKDWQGIQPELLQEPRMALEGGSDGLFFYRKILMQASQHLHAGGWLFLELGQGQDKVVATLVDDSCYDRQEWIKDDLGITRVLAVRRK